MKKLIVILVSLVVIPCICTAAEQVYREVDEKGVPSFSDHGAPGAEKVKISTPITFSNKALMQQHSLRQEQTEASKATPDYTRLEITNPANDAAVRENSGELTLSITIAPGVQAGHKAQLLMDGLAIRTLQGSGPVSLSNVDRGTHSFSVRIVDGRGKVIDTGPATSISMLRHSPARPTHSPSRAN